MLHDIVNFIGSIWHFFIHAIQGISTLVYTGLTMTGVVAEVFAWLPAVVSGFCFLTVTILFVKLFIGRN